MGRCTADTATKGSTAASGTMKAGRFTLATSMSTSPAFRARRRWITRLGRLLALVIQLAFVLTPMMEGREERLLGAHVEAPRTQAHPGHHPDWCPVCQMLSVHGMAPARQELAEFPLITGGCAEH